MPPDPVTDEDEDYASSEDSDFAPDQGQAAASEASNSDDDEQPQTSSKPRGATANETEDAGYDNSGDEAIIKRGKKRRNRAADDDDEVGGEGGLIKTRRQKAAEKEEQRYHQANSGPVTIDVDAVWQQMMSGKTATERVEEPSNAMDLDDDVQIPEKKKTDRPPADAEKEEPSMIRIKRTYNFAGQVHTEEKLVPRDSAEAKLFLASGGEPLPDDALPTKRSTRKAFRSAFEPLTDPLPQRGDLNLGVAARQMASRDAAAKKLNTVEKSRMDWAGFVDKEGIKEDLELAGRSKGAFNDREAFLARSEAIRDEEAKKVRMAARA